MQVGIVNEENFPQILRGISQRRRHGVLELHAGERIFEIYFYQGKIIDVARDKKLVLRQIAELLVARGVLFEGDWLSGEITPGILFEQSEIAGYDLSQESLRKVWEQRMLECLYSIELSAGSYYNFRIEFVSAPDALAVQISVGQLLLDLVGYREGHSAFVARCAETAPICRGTPADRDYSFEENDLIWMVDGESTVASLRERSVLNRLTFEDTLLSLLGEGILRLGDGDDSPVLSGGVLDLDAALDACIDNALGSVTGQDTPESLVRDLWSEKQSSKGEQVKNTAPQAFNISRLCEEMSARALMIPAIPHLVLGLFIVLAVMGPWILW